MTARTLRLALAFGAFLRAGVVRATPHSPGASLEIATLDGRSWADSVAAFQVTLASEGSTVRVVVSDRDGRRAACGEYALLPDVVTAAAFTIEACDPATSATALRLVHRDALFGPGEVVPTPLTASLSATELRTGTVSGGAPSVGGSDVQCSVTVRPYLRDLQHGTPVYLTPDRFGMRVLSAQVFADVTTNAWRLRAYAATVAEYEVYDLRRPEVAVLHDRATVACEVAPVGPTPRVAPAPRVTPAPARTLVGEPEPVVPTVLGTVDKTAGGATDDDEPVTTLRRRPGVYGLIRIGGGVTLPVTGDYANEVGTGAVGDASFGGGIDGATVGFRGRMGFGFHTMPGTSPDGGGPTLATITVAFRFVFGAARVSPFVEFSSEVFLGYNPKHISLAERGTSRPSHEDASYGLGLGAECALTRSVLLDLAVHYDGLYSMIAAPGGSMLSVLSGLTFRF